MNARQIVLVACLRHPREQLVEVCHVDRGQPFGGVAGGKRLEGDAHGVCLLDVVNGEWRDDGLLAGRHDHEALSLEKPEGLTHGHDAHAELIGQGREPKGCTRRQLAVDDQLPQPLRYRLGQGPGVVRSAEDVGQHYDLPIPSHDRPSSDAPRQKRCANPQDTRRTAR